MERNPASRRSRVSSKLLKTFQLGPPGGAINQVAFTPDGRHLVTANGNGTVYVLRLKEWSAGDTEGGVR